MNSFQELNFYGNTGVPFADDRAYTISFSSNTATNNSNITIFESQTFIANVGIDITNVQATPRNIIYSIDLSNAPGASVNWTSNVPDNIILSNTSSNFSANGVNGKYIWDLIKNPEIIMPGRFITPFSFTSTILYPNTANVILSNTHSWTTNVDIIAISQLPLTTNSYAYSTGTSGRILNVPEINNLTYPGFQANTYTMILSTNNISAVSSMSTTGNLGGTSSFNSSTKELTLTGNRDSINDRLQNLVYTPISTTITDITLALLYSLSNPTSLYTSLCHQTLYPVHSTYSLSNTSTYEYLSYVENTILNVPLIQQTANINEVYTLTVTSNSISAIGNLSTTGNLGGTSSYNPSNATLTVTGTALSINERLSNLHYQPTDSELSWTATYTLNPGSTFEKTKIQTIESASAKYLTTPGSSYYDEDTWTTILNYPNINSSASGTYILKVFPITNNTVSELSSTGIGGTSSFNNSTKELTISGTLSQVQSHLSNISLLSYTDYTSDFLLEYRLTLPNGTIANRRQQILFGKSNALTTNLDINRTAYSNTPDQMLFSSNTPQINETIVPAPTYSVVLTSTSGYFGSSNANPQSTYTITGTKTYVNSLLSTVKYYPIKDISGPSAITFTQSRNGIQQFSQTIGLTILPRSTAIPGIGQFTFNSSGAFTPTYEQAYYLTATIGAIGAGGPQKTNQILYTVGDGGGGGGIDVTTRILGTLTPISFVIGQGESWISNGDTTVTGNGFTLFGGKGQQGTGSKQPGYVGAFGGQSGTPQNTAGGSGNPKLYYLNSYNELVLYGSSGGRGGSSYYNNDFSTQGGTGGVTVNMNGGTTRSSRMGTRGTAPGSGGAGLGLNGQYIGGPVYSNIIDPTILNGTNGQVKIIFK